MTQAATASFVGAILVLAGITQIFVQMLILYRLERDKDVAELSFAPPKHRAQIGLSKWSFQTSYPGVLMIVVGALLLGLTVAHSN